MTYEKSPFRTVHRSRIVGTDNGYSRRLAAIYGVGLLIYKSCHQDVRGRWGIGDMNAHLHARCGSLAAQTKKVNPS